MFLMAFENKAGMPIEPATFQLYVPALGALWRDSGIKEAFSRRSEYQLVSTSNFMVGAKKVPCCINVFSVERLLATCKI